jgi:hypothetical protein
MKYILTVSRHHLSSERVAVGDRRVHEWCVVNGLMVSLNSGQETVYISFGVHLSTRLQQVVEPSILVTALNYYYYYYYFCYYYYYYHYYYYYPVFITSYGIILD